MAKSMQRESRSLIQDYVLHSSTCARGTAGASLSDRSGIHQRDGRGECGRMWRACRLALVVGAERGVVMVEYRQVARLPGCQVASAQPDVSGVRSCAGSPKSGRWV